MEGTDKDIKIYYKSKINIKYKSHLERLFFFNRNQSRYVKKINESIVKFSSPVIKKNGTEIELSLKQSNKVQTLHLFDKEGSDADLIGVVLYVRENKELITIVHIALDEYCSEIFKRSDTNIAIIVMNDLVSIFRKLKGVKKIKLFYTGVEIKI